MDVAGFGVIREHVSYLFLGKSCHLIESIAQCIVGPDVKTACQVIHGDWSDTCYEHSFYGRVGARLDGVEEGSQVPCTMCLRAVIVKTFWLGKNLVGEVVVLIDKQIYLLTSLLAYITEVIQLLGCTVLLVHFFFCVRW